MTERAGADRAGTPGRAAPAADDALDPPAAALDAALDDPARVAALATTHYENFPVGSVLVPKRLRPHIHRIYAFARTADDLADEWRDAAALATYRQDFERSLDAPSEPAIPLFADLRASIVELDLPRELFLALLDAFAQDLEKSRYANDDELFAYCRWSADPVGRLVLRVFGHRSDELDALSDRICTGLQLLNHLQDIGSDLVERDRIYFPRDDLARFDVTEDDLRLPSAGPTVRALVEYWLTRTADLLREGWPLVRAVGGRLRYELRAIVGGAAAVVAAIRRADHDVLGADVHLGRGDKLGVLARAVLSSRLPPALAEGAGR